MELPDVTLDIPVSADQASLLLADLSTKFSAQVSHALQLGPHVVPGQWRVYAVRADYVAGVRQHWASVEWQGVVT